MNIYYKIKKHIFISLGAIPGVIFRWQIKEVFIVNILGCLLIGLFHSLSVDSKYKYIVCVGFCGSLTTFSGWMFMIFKLISAGLYVQATFSTMLMLVSGVFAVCLGDLLAKRINKLF